MADEKKKRYNLEKDVIVSVTVLYLFIMCALLSIHYLVRL